MTFSTLPFWGLLLLPLIFLPAFTDPFMTPKWLCLHLLASLVAFSWFRRGEVSFPRLGKSARGILILAILYLLSMVLNPGGAYLSQILDFTCFAVIAIAAFDEGSSSAWYALNRHGTILVLAFAGVELFSLGFWRDSEPSLFLSSTFGFQNLTAEFLGISLLVQLASLSEEKRLNKTSLALFLVTLTYFFSLVCRSALVAFFFAQFFFRVKLRKLFLVFLISLLVVGPLAFLKWGDQLGPLLKQKATNVSLRTTRWRNTLKLIADHPWGVGPGNYEFAYIPYRSAVSPDTEVSPTSLPRSPHNGYLEAFAESGFAFGVAVLVAVTALGIFLFRQKRALVSSLFVFLVVDALFAFPMETAYPFYAAALMLGLGFASGFEKRKVKARFAFLGFSAAILGVAGTQALTDHILAVHAGNETLVHWACKSSPEDWRACLQEGELKVETDPKGAARIADEITGKMPLNNFAWDLKQRAASRQGDTEAARLAKSQYEKIWGRP